MNILDSCEPALKVTKTTLDNQDYLSQHYEHQTSNLTGTQVFSQGDNAANTMGMFIQGSKLIQNQDFNDDLSII